MKYLLTAKRLRKALNECGIRPQDLSDRSGVSKASISQYLNGSHKPSNTSSGKYVLCLKNVSVNFFSTFSAIKNGETKVSPKTVICTFHRRISFSSCI